MKLKYSFLILSLIIILISFQAVSASELDENQTIISNDSPLGVSVDVEAKLGDSGTFSELQTEIDRGGTINLTNNYTIGEKESEVVINRDIIINGNGNTINANFNSRIFNINGANVVLNNITFINGAKNNVIYVISGNLTVNNCNFTNNSVTTISASETNLTINDTVFSINNATTVSVSNCNLTVFNSTFDDNEGLSINAGGSEIILNKSYFTNNHATNTGVYISNSYLNVVNSFFSGNIAWNRRNLGADENSIYEITNTTFDVKADIYTYNLKTKGNETLKILFDDGTNLFLSQKVDLYVNNKFNTTFTVDDTKYWEYGLTNLDTGDYAIKLQINNSANNNYNTDHLEKTFKVEAGVQDEVYISPTGHGSGSKENPTNWENAQKSIAVGGTIIFTKGTYNITNETITSNITLKGENATINAQSKGRIFTIKYNANVIIEEITFINGNSILSDYNYADGGAIYIDNATISLKKSVFTNNTAYDGGAIYSKGKNENIINSSFKNNTVKNNGGAIYLDSTNNILRDSHFEKNNASSGGGAIYWNNNGIIDNVTFDNNNAISYGGAIYFNGKDSNIINSVFTNNKQSSMVINAGGGAIYVTSTVTNLNITSNFTNNTAAYYGGAIKCYGQINIINSNFNENKAGYAGGAINMADTNCDIKIIHSKFDKNNISSNPYGNARGGAIYIDGAVRNVTIIDSNFTNNTAPYYGGAINCYGNMTIINSTFEENKDEYHGAAIYLSSNTCDVKIIESRFNKNNVTTSLYGVASSGAIFIANTVRNVTIIDSNFTNNSASNYGGAISCNGNMTIINSNFDGNYIYSSGAGGAIALRDKNANVKIINSTFTNNRQDKFQNGYYGGGAIYIIGGANIIIINSNFTNNTAKQCGAISCSGSMNIIGSTFTNNTVNGNIYNIFSTSSQNISNSTFDNNVTPTITYVSDDSRKITFTTFNAGITGTTVTLKDLLL